MRVDLVEAERYHVAKIHPLLVLNIRDAILVPGGKLDLFLEAYSELLVLNTQVLVSSPRTDDINFFAVPDKFRLLPLEFEGVSELKLRVRIRLLYKLINSVISLAILIHIVRDR